MLLYWGRRGALSRLTLELARAARSLTDVSATLSVSRQNEAYDTFERSGSPVFPVTTFESSFGAVAGVGQMLAVRRALAERIVRDRTEAVIALMPHVWGQLMIDTVHAAGARYVTIVHDAMHHPGDKSRRLHQWLLREAVAADHVVTLSHTVTAQLLEHAIVDPSRISTSFLPEIDYGAAARMPEPDVPYAPFRVLFFGRVLQYKGLPLLVDAVERLRASGLRISLGVYGEGDLRALRPRLDALGADVVNRWIPEQEVASVFRRYHAVALSHTEASQSGVAAAALGAGLPVIALPVGGIVEQIRHGETGLLARSADVISLAEAIAILARDSSLYRRLIAGIARTRSERSTERFVADLVAIACAPEQREANRRTA
jgi:glycosyltransferase involved in cell wall biosynthesis